MNKMGPRLQRICSQQWSYIEIDIWPEQKTYFKVTACQLLYREKFAPDKDFIYN